MNVGSASLVDCSSIGLEARAILAGSLNFGLALLFGPRMIAWLRVRFRESINSPSPAVQRLHEHKQATPTMGGLGIVAAICGSLLLLADWRNPFVPLAALVTIALGFLGLADDLTKLRSQRRGISARAKLAGQIVVAAAAAIALYCVQRHVPGGLLLELPIGRGPIDLGIWFVPLAMLVIVGSSNAVNLTDGLDGLAGGCLVASFGSLAVVTFATGHEMAVVATAALGAVLGFLRFNCHPAAVFMGDTGSLPLGGLLGLVALAARQELLLIVLGGVFVAEAASVIAQVAAFRCTGRRVFLCAPLHHHFQLRGWPEPKIVARFWIAATLCAACGLGGWAVGIGTARIGTTREIRSSRSLAPTRLVRAEHYAGPLKTRH
jgi:phospho-N-acetylmuramoyl-pentapeptide-transferase